MATGALGSTLAKPAKPKQALMQWNNLSPETRRQTLYDRFAQGGMSPGQMNIARTLGEQTAQQLSDPSAMRRWDEPNRLASAMQRLRQTPSMSPESMQGMADATASGVARGRLEAGLREPATPIAQDPELAENVGALRQGLGGDLNVNRLRPGQDTFMVSSPGSGGMSLMMGGRAAADRLSPTSATRAPQPAGPDRIIGPTSMLPRRRDGEPVPAGTYGDLIGYTPAMLDEARSRGRASLARYMQDNPEADAGIRERRAARLGRTAGAPMAERLAAVQENAKAKADARATRRQGPMARAIAGGGSEDQFERALEIAAMTPGNPMAPQAGALLAKMRGDAADRAANQPLTDAQIAAANADAELKRVQAEQIGKVDPNSPPLTPEQKIGMQAAATDAYNQAIAGGASRADALKFAQSQYADFVPPPDAFIAPTNPYSTGNPLKFITGGYAMETIGESFARDPAAAARGYETSLADMLRRGVITPEQAAELRRQHAARTRP